MHLVQFTAQNLQICYSFSHVHQRSMQQPKSLFLYNQHNLRRL